MTRSDLPCHEKIRHVNDGSTRETLLSTAREATQSQRRRLSEVKAREHVGAAGWAQTSALDSILRAGQEGRAATDALRQVVHLTTEQLRSLPMKEMSLQRGGHLEALENIVQSSNDQITASQVMDDLICDALEDVSQVPVDDLNIRQLKNIHARLQDQVNALYTIIDAARVQARTLEQVADLEQISAQHQQRVSEIRQFSNEEHLSALGEAGAEIVSRIAEVDDAHVKQLDALEQIGEAVVENLPETGANAQQQIETLEKIAQAAHDKAAEVRGEDQS